MKQIAIIGIQGVPAQYGGFESLVENIIGENCSSDIHYTIFCSSKDYVERRTTYKGASLKYIPLHANGMQSTPYDIWSMLLACRGYDVVVILGVSGCLFLPVFRLLYWKRVIVNIDGLEHRREKWGRFAKWFLRQSEAMAVRCASVVVADNKAIQDYVREIYGKDSALIAYGGDHTQCQVPSERQETILKRYHLTRERYGLTVCRIEPENNCHLTLEAFARSGKRLVFVGNWEHSAYGRELRSRYAAYPHISMVDPVYDLSVLFALRKNCRYYLHGHSAGGTNPSLVEAMFFGKPILAYDVVYNRETTENRADYFRTAEELSGLLKNEEWMAGKGEAMLAIAERRYRWKTIARQYEALYRGITGQNKI